MANKAVLDMLKKPIQKTAGRIDYPQTSGGLPSILEAELHDMAMERIHKKAFDNAMAELGPKITEAEERATKAETELAETKSTFAALQAKHNEMEAMHKAEMSAKEAANMACDEECQKRIAAESKNMELSGRISELEKANVMLQKTIASMTSEIGKIKKVPEPAKPASSALSFEVVSRDLNGAIKTVTIKPK